MKWYYYSVFITIAGRGVSQLSLCLKCSLEQSTSLSTDDSVACCRGFVAPNTGDRLCGITVCVMSVPACCTCGTPMLITIWSSSAFFSFWLSWIPAPGSIWRYHTLPHSPGSDCLECTLISGCNSEVSVTTWMTNHLDCVLFCSASCIRWEISDGINFASYIVFDVIKGCHYTAFL